MTLKFYNNVIKGLKLKVSKFWYLIRTFGERTENAFWGPLNLADLFIDL